jgi:hypothetical protein
MAELRDMFLEGLQAKDLIALVVMAGFILALAIWIPEIV